MGAKLIGVAAARGSGRPASGLDNARSPQSALSLSVSSAASRSGGVKRATVCYIQLLAAVRATAAADRPKRTASYAAVVVLGL